MQDFEFEIFKANSDRRLNIALQTDDLDLFKSWSSDLQKQFPNGGWRTINGAKVFIDGGKVVAGLNAFNGKIDEFFKEKEAKGTESSKLNTTAKDIIDRTIQGHDLQEKAKGIDYSDIYDVAQKIAQKDGDSNVYWGHVAESIGLLSTKPKDLDNIASFKRMVDGGFTGDPTADRIIELGIDNKHNILKEAKEHTNFFKEMQQEIKNIGLTKERRDSIKDFIPTDITKKDFKNAIKKIKQGASLYHAFHSDDESTPKEQGKNEAFSKDDLSKMKTDEIAQRIELLDEQYNKDTRTAKQGGLTHEQLAGMTDPLYDEITKRFVEKNKGIAKLGTTEYSDTSHKHAEIKVSPLLKNEDRLLYNLRLGAHSIKDEIQRVTRSFDTLSDFYDNNPNFKKTQEEYLNLLKIRAKNPHVRFVFRS